MIASANPDTIPGMICGITTLRSAIDGDAPRSIAASYRLASICFNFGTTDRYTNGADNTTWPISSGT